MRYRGDGPVFTKIGRSIFYDIDDVRAFEESQKRTRTDELPQEVA
ncbi:MAG TPA: hypothetical protein VJY40_03160 [Corynebacterium sp.]|nr:hypothetical protein [Corynebacterium sp.]